MCQSRQLEIQVCNHPAHPFGMRCEHLLIGSRRPVKIRIGYSPLLSRHSAENNGIVGLKAACHQSPGNSQHHSHSCIIILKAAEIGIIVGRQENHTLRMSSRNTACDVVGGAVSSDTGIRIQKHRQLPLLLQQLQQHRIAILCGAVDVVLQDERVFQALLVGQDAQSDLAVLKIDCAGLTPAQFGDSTLLEVGDAVAAIGNPLGEELRGTMTDGIISAINRDVNVGGYTMVLLQTTAALNSGNSGGALINDRGQVVGITNLKMRAYDNTVEGLGFAIPTTTVKTVVDALIAHGRVEGRPTIGITGYTVTEELAEEYGCPRGVAVQSVREGSDAQRQGVLPNDVIVAVNGETITDMDQLQAIKEGLAVGDVLTFRLWRGGHYLERDVALVDQYTLEE